MTRAVVGLWTLLFVYGLLLFGDFILKAADQVRSHVEARSENMETAAARKTGGASSQAGSGVLSHVSVSVLSRVSEGSL